MWKNSIGFAGFLLGMLVCLAGCLQAPSGTLTGTVELEEQSNHEGIQVYLPGTQFRAMTGENGTFVITGIPPDVYPVVAEYSGYTPYRAEIEVKRGINELPAVITLNERIPETGAISGFVSIPEQTIHEGIVVMVVDQPMSTQTNTTGYYELEQVPPGTHSIVAYKEGWLPLTQEGIRVMVNQVTKVSELTLNPFPGEQEEERSTVPQSLGNRHIRGYAFLQGSLQHEGIKVSLKEYPSFSTITNATGMYVLSGIDSATHTLVFEHEGYLTYEMDHVVPVRPGSNQVSGFITLRRSGEFEGEGILQGTVLLEGEVYHANTIIRLEDHEQAVVTGEDGKYVLVGIEAGKYTLTAEHPGYQTGVIENVVVMADQINPAPDITLQSIQEESKGEGGLRGVAYLEGQLDHSGILVAIEGTGYTLVTAADGIYEFENVPAGFYNILFSKANYKETLWNAAPVVNLTVNEIDPVVLKPDIDPPRVIDIFPQPNARAVPIAGWVDVLIRFSERMSGASVKGALRIDPPVSYEAFFDRESELSDLDVLHVRLYQDAPEPIRFKTEYDVMITPEAQTPKGIGLEEPFAFSFQTDGPLILGSVPQEGDLAFLNNLADPIYVETNAPVHQSDVERSLRFRPRPESEPMVNVYPLGYGSQILIFVSLKPNTRYRLMFDQNLKTLDGGRFSNTPYSISFTTRSNDPLRVRRGPYPRYTR